MEVAETLDGVEIRRLGLSSFGKKLGIFFFFVKLPKIIGMQINTYLMPYKNLIQKLEKKTNQFFGKTIC